MHRLLIAIFGLLLTVGLSGNRTFAQSQTLETALSFKERPSGKTAQSDRSIDSTQHLASIDFASLLIIKPDSQRLRGLAGTRQAVLDSLSETDKTRLDTLPALIKAAQAYIDEAARVIANLEEAQSTGDALSAAQIANLQQQIRTQAALGRQVTRPVLAIATARANELFPNDEDAAVAMIGTMTRPIFRDAQDERVLLNVPALAAFLREHLTDAEGQIQNDVETAGRQGKAQFRMRAWLLQPGQAPTAIGIDNYDNIKNLAGPKRSRIAIRMTPQEQRRLAKGLALSAVAGTFIREVRHKRSSLRTGLRDLRQTALDEVKSLGDLRIDILADTTLNFIRQGVEVALEKGNAVHKPRLQALQGFLTTFEDTLQIISDGIDQLKASSDSPEALIQQALALPQKVNQAIQLAMGYAGEVRTNVSRLSTLQDVLNQLPAPTEPDSLSIASRIGVFLPLTKDSLTAFADGPLAMYAKAAQLLSNVINRQQIVHVGDVMDGVSVDPRVQALDLDQVKQGKINLEETPADRGDHVEIRAELFTVDDAGQEDILDTTSIVFRIQRFGFTSEITSHLIFSDRIQDNVSPTDSTVSDPAQFDPATSASWTLHYRPRTGPGASGLAKVWSFLDPGFGVNVAALGFDDANFQIGLGAHFSLFDDLLSFGYGYNLQADEDQKYYYLGIGILEAFNSFGNLVSGAPR